MSAEFESIHNHNERAVFDAVLRAAPNYPKFATDQALLADVACVALNRVPARYIRNQVDYAFYMTDQERSEVARQVAQAVQFGFEFVQARLLMRART